MTTTYDDDDDENWHLYYSLQIRTSSRASFLCLKSLHHNVTTKNTK